MRKAYNVAAVRSAEAALMARVPPGTLMARAAAGLARTCSQLLDAVYASRIVLLVGSGDNGGDALFAGALLAARGARVDALLLGAAPPGGAAAHLGGLAALRAAGGRVLDASAGPIETAIDLLERADLVVDGIVGIGGHGALREAAARLVEAIAADRTWRVAADLPSGIDADTGHRAGAAFAADVTVTFGCLKPGLLVGPGAELAGVVELVDIGLTDHLPAESSLMAPETADIAALWPVPPPNTDKYARGVVGVVAGSAVYPGAAVLCTGGAVRAGAGMVRYLGEGAAAAAVAGRWPEVVHGDGRVQAYVVGPGLGTDTDAVERVHATLAADVPVLVDADGLSILAEHQYWARTRVAPTVLTPHDREFERFGHPIGDDRRAAALRLADDLGVTVLLKGSRTVVAEPGGVVHVNPTGTSWLATAGSGDVLSGIIGTLLASGIGSMAPVAGAFVHGLAGRIAAEAGPVSAWDVVQAVGPAIGILLTGDRQSDPRIDA